MLHEPSSSSPPSTRSGTLSGTARLQATRKLDSLFEATEWATLRVYMLSFDITLRIGFIFVIFFIRLTDGNSTSAAIAKICFSLRLASKLLVIFHNLTRWQLHPWQKLNFCRALALRVYSAHSVKLVPWFLVANVLHVELGLKIRVCVLLWLAAVSNCIGTRVENDTLPARHKQ